MKLLHLIAVAAGVAAAMAMPAQAAVGQPVPGQESVAAFVSIDTAGVASWAQYQQTHPEPTTPFVLTRGTSNAVHGMPSNPVFGGNLSPFQLDSSNQLIPANMPLNLLNHADAQSWDKQSFAYTLGNGPSFSVGVAAMAWNQTATAIYSYRFEHINQTAQTEALSAISLHVDPGRLFLIPRFGPGGDGGSQYTLVNASFSHQFRVEVDAFDGLLPQVKGAGFSAAVITLSGPQTFGIGQVLTFPPGLNQLANGIAVQNIPEQTLSLPPFDLLPDQRLTVSVQMSVSALATGTGPSPILYALAGDPLSLSTGGAAPNVLLHYAPAAVPEPATGLLLLAGIVGLRLSRCHRHLRAAQSLACLDGWRTTDPAPPSGPQLAPRHCGRRFHTACRRAARWLIPRTRSHRTGTGSGRSRPCR